MVAYSTPSQCQTANIERIEGLAAEGSPARPRPFLKGIAFRQVEVGGIPGHSTSVSASRRWAGASSTAR